MPYFSGIKETIHNKDVVIKIKNKAPFIIPILFFSVPTIIMNVIFLFTDNIVLLLFFMIYIVSLMFYFMSIYILIRDLRKEFEIETKPIKIDKVQEKKRLLLINPVNQDVAGLTINPSSTFPPLGLGIIAVLTPDNFQVKLIDENFDKFEYEDADLVGITAFTSVANRAYEISAHYKKKGIPVIMGEYTHQWFLKKL